MGVEDKEKRGTRIASVYLLMNTRVCIDKGKPVDASSTFHN